jgi:hypothetical protein
MTYEIKSDDFCEICGKPASETELTLIAHGSMLACAGECDPRYNHPRQRDYAELTPEILDELELKADEACLWVDVKSSVLHSMIREVRRGMSPKRDLPTPCQLMTAHHWLWSGCPSYPVKRFGGRLDPKVAIDILYELVEALPSHFPQYCHGTPEHRDAMVKCQGGPKPKCWHEDFEGE